jgi:TRAP transporter TAXI family solute receptor
MAITFIPRRWQRITLIVFLVLALPVAVFWFYIPQTPSTLTIASGYEGGTYEQFAQRLQKELKKEGVDLILQRTQGSIDNLNLLKDPNSKIDFALFQSGVADPKKYPNIVSLAGIFYEPLWIWYRVESFRKEGGKLSQFNQLIGKRISIGNHGSGTQVLAKELITANQISFDSMKVYALNPTEAAKKLQEGEIDVAFLVSSTQAPVLKSFYENQNIHLMNLNHAEAYSKILPYLSHVVVPRGLLSITKDYPREDLNLVSPTAVLVARDDISPAIVSLLMRASVRALKNDPGTERDANFPSSERLEFPQHIDAEIYLKEGPSFLYSNLPFWGAVWVGRFLKIFIPLLVIFPFFAYVPALLRYSFRRRLWQFYKELKVIERISITEENYLNLLNRLEQLDKRVLNLKISTLAPKEYHDLRAHINFARSRIEQSIDRLSRT